MEVAFIKYYHDLTVSLALPQALRVCITLLTLSQEVNHVASSSLNGSGILGGLDDTKQLELCGVGDLQFGKYLKYRSTLLNHNIKAKTFDYPYLRTPVTDALGRLLNFDRCRLL